MAGKRLCLRLPGGRDPEPGVECVGLSEVSAAHSARWDEVVIAAGSLAELRRALPWTALLGRARQVTVTVAATDRPARLRVPAAVGRRVPVSGRLIRDGDAVTVEVVLPKPTEVAMTVRAMLDSGLRAAVRTAGLRVGIGASAALSWSAGDMGIAPAEECSTEHDVVITPDPGWGLPPVDTAICSPEGFGPAGARLAQLTATDGALDLVRDGQSHRIDPLLGITENDLRALREVAAVEVAGDGPGLGRVLSQLCCAGVPVSAPDLSVAIADQLGAGLAERLRGPVPLPDATARESWSIDTRRAALSRFAPDAYWTGVAAELGMPTAGGPTVSVLLATRRTALLPFALAQIARQDWPSLHTVLLLHGPGRDDPAVQAAMAGFDRPLDVVEVGSDIVFGHALNVGLARCTGDLVTKFDDDDWYGPHHVTDLVQAHQHSGATLVGVGGYYVYLAGPDVTLRWTQVATEAPTVWVHGGTMLLATADLRALGAWPGVAVAEDAHLLRTVRAAGGSIYGIHDLGFCYFRGRDHTWMPAEGDTRWLDADLPRWSGFVPPPQLDPLPHPWLG